MPEGVGYVKPFEAPTVPEIQTPSLVKPKESSVLPSQNKDATSQVIRTAIEKTQHEVSAQNKVNSDAIEAFKKAQELMNSNPKEGDVILDMDSYETPNIMGYDIRSYATDPNHEKAVASIVNKVGKFNTLSDLNAYVKQNYPTSPITGEMIAAASAKHKVPWEMMLAIMAQDSSMGTKGKGARTFNPGNVGNDDAGNIVNYGNWQSGVNAVAEWLSKHRVDTTKKPLASGSKTALGVVTTQFGGGTAIEKHHPGIDIANEIDTPIPFYQPGVVTEVVKGKKQADVNNPNDPNKGYGNYVIVTGEDGTRYRYSHLNKAYVKVGDTVQRGEVGMTMGNSGSTYSTSGGSGSHLDLRIQNAAGKYLDPSLFM